MTNPAVYVVAAVVIGFAALMGFIAGSSKPQATSYGRGGSGSGTKSRYSPPPSPPRRRRRSPQRRSKSLARAATSTNMQHVTCKNCNESPFITVMPCNHESLCKGCFENSLRESDTCPDCQGRIDSCLPPIPPFGKCGSCKKFTKLFKFLDCNHSLSLCISCFEKQNVNYKKCPECDLKIKGSEPHYTTAGVCGVCDEFTRYAKFHPCGHGKFCRRCASMYLESSGLQCSECEKRVKEIV